MIRIIVSVVIAILAVLPACAWDRTLAWDPNDISEWVNQYNVYEVASDGSSPVLVGSVTATTGVADASETVYDLVSRIGVECFAVTAVNSVGESGLSNVVCAPIPSKPTGERVEK